MTILYISTLIPQAQLDEVLKRDKSNYVVAPQKFHRMLVKGFAENGHDVAVLSYLPPCLDYIPSANEDGVDFFFARYKNKPGLKHLQIARNIFSEIKKMVKKGRKPDALVCDILNVSVCLGALLAGRRFRIKTCGIVTDILGISAHEEKSLINRAAAKTSNSYITMFDSYVILTRQMNEVVNPKNRPYIVMEGVCGTTKLEQIEPSDDTFKIFYAGGRPSKDGVDLLVSAFKRLEGEHLRLNVYGSMPDGIIGTDPEDRRIYYHGIVDNNEIVAEERRSSLLVNPRPTGETYTLYSFPSKVMEYMATGVPMVTTRLAGIPEEYFQHVFSFESCEAESYYHTLAEILALPHDVLKLKGEKAQKFVLEKKNNIAQTARIIELIKNL